MRLITTIALALLGLTTWAQTSLPDLPTGAQRYSQTLWLVPSDSTLWTGATGNYAQVATREQLRQLAAQGYTKSQVDSAITSQIGLIDFPVTSVAGKTGDVGLDASDVGLGNVDNTTDLDKPISTATQGALDGKENAFSKGSLVAGTGVTLSGTLANRLVGSGNVTINATNSLTASNGLQIISGVISPQYGTLSGTVAQGNDTRINNGQTAFGWGNYRQFGLGTQGADISPSSSWDVLGTSQFVRSSNASNSPFSAYGVGVNIPYVEGSGRGGQLFIGVGGDGLLQYRSTIATTTDWRAVRTVWDDSNFTPSDYLLTSTRGVANGVASLDGSGKVPSSQLPTGGMQYRGTWNASTNTPTLSNATGTDGHFYRVTTAGTQNLGSGNITFSVGDDVIHNGSVWQRAPSGSTSTNLAIGTRTATTMPITNSNGTGVTIPAATTSLAGLLSGADKTKLNSALTSETDPTVPAHVKAITSGQISNWNTAYGWGDFRDFGLGTQGVDISPSSSWDVLGTSQFVRSTSVGNSPFSAYGVGVNLSYIEGSGRGGQLFIGVGGDGLLQYRSTIATTTDWRAVRTVWDDSNFTPSDYLLTSNFTWSNLSGKPSTFAPSPHSHSAADINSGTLAAARIGNATVSNAKLANMTANTIKGRSGSTGAPQDLTAAQARTILNVAETGTGASQTRTNSQLDGRYVQLTGNQSISGTKTFNSPTVAPQYQGTSTTASSSIPTNAQSLFKATISSNTNYTLTNLSGNPRQIQVMVTNTSGSTVYVNFSGGSVRMADGATDNVPASATVIFTFLIENGSAWGVKSTFL